MIGKRIKDLRKSKKITQDELGSILGLSGKSAISNYENGYSAPDNEMLNKIADYFNVSTDYLLGRTDDPIPVRDVNQDLMDEHSYEKELKDFLKDRDLPAMFHNYGNWTEERKMILLNFLKAQEALEKAEKNED